MEGSKPLLLVDRLATAERARQEHRTSLWTPWQACSRQMRQRQSACCGAEVVQHFDGRIDGTERLVGSAVQRR